MLPIPDLIDKYTSILKLRKLFATCFYAKEDRELPLCTTCYSMVIWVRDQVCYMAILCTCWQADSTAKNEKNKYLFACSFLNSQSEVKWAAGRDSQIVCGLDATENNSLNGCRKMWRFWKSILCQVVPVCVLVSSVSNHSDPRVAWLGQGAGIQWRGCPAEAANFRCQSKSGMEREVDMSSTQVIIVAKAEVGVRLCVFMWVVWVHNLLINFFHEWDWGIIFVSSVVPVGTTSLVFHAAEIFFVLVFFFFFPL